MSRSKNTSQSGCPAHGTKDIIRLDACNDRFAGGMNLLCAVLLDCGDTVIVEGPTYPGALHAMRKRGARFLSVPCDKDGLRTVLLPQIIVHYAKKCEAMDAAFREYFPENAIYHKPEGGFFWIKVPGVDSRKLFMKAIERGVAFVT